MSGLEPVRCAHRTQCARCGAGMDDQETAEVIAEYADGVEAPTPLCCNACDKAYKASKREDIEEFEEVFRAGAT